MPDADHTLRLLIQLSTQGSEEAKAALELLEKYKRTADESAKGESAGGGGHVNLRGFRREARDVMEFTQEVTKDMPLVNEALGKYRYELTMAAYEAAQKYPQIAESIGRVAIAATAATIVYGYFKKELEQVNAELDKQGEEAAKATINFRELTRQVELGMAKAFSDLKRVEEDAADGLHTLAADSARAIEQMKADFADFGAVGEEETKLEVARIKFLAQQKIITEEDAQRRLEQVQLTAAARKRQMEDDQMATEIRIKEASVARAAQEAEQLEPEVIAGEILTREREGRVKQLEAARKDAAEKAKKELDRVEKGLSAGLLMQFEEAGVGANFDRAFPQFAENDVLGYRAKFRDWQTAKAGLLQAQRVEESPEERREAVVAEESRRETERIRKQRDEAVKLSVEGSQSLTEQRAKLADLRDKHRELSGMEAEAARLHGYGGLGDRGEGGGGLRGVIRSGLAAKLTPGTQDDADLRKLEDTIRLMGGSQQTLTRIFGKLHVHVISLDQAVERMEKELNASRTSRYHPQG